MIESFTNGEHPMRPIRFDADKPLPTSLVRKIVKDGIAENAAQHL
jgi:uncharacterized protein YdhG (YjbR/CyaY superfamily)